MVLGCLLDWPAVRPCRLAVCRTSTINRWTSRLRPEGHTCSFGGSRPVRSATCTCAASPTGTKRLRTVESPRWCFSFGGRRAARIPVLATVRRDRRPRPSAVPRVRRREKPGRHHSSAGIVGCRSGSAAMLHRNDPERAGVGFGDGTTHLGLPSDFLLDADGTVAAVHYGRHADDQWSVDQLIDINRSLGGKGTQ